MGPAPDIRTPLPGPKARAIVERDGRAVSPSYTRAYPFVMARGEGAVVEDVDGNLFIDCAAGIALANCYRCPLGLRPESCEAQCLRFVEEQLLVHLVSPDEVAAVMVEPIQGEGGYVGPPAHFLRRLRDLARRARQHVPRQSRELRRRTRDLSGPSVAPRTRPGGFAPPDSPSPSLAGAPWPLRSGGARPWRTRAARGVGVRPPAGVSPWGRADRRQRRCTRARR